MKTSIVVGSRGSQLALIQAQSVIAKIKEINHRLDVRLNKIITTGDRDRRIRLDQIGNSGVFVKELEEALLDGRIDVAVHSLKDMPTQLPPGLCLLAVTERLDSRDVFVSKSGRLNELTPGAKVGTGSLRRAAQLRQYRPDLEVLSLRGNVDTRLRQVSRGEVDGVILSAAALARLNCEDKITEYLPLKPFLPAVGQGALGIEARVGDEEIAELISPLNHLPTWQSIRAERAFLKALGGGCRAPIAALGQVKDTTLKLEGMVANISGEKLIYGSEEGSTLSPEEIGLRLAQKLWEMGASEFIAEAKSK